QGTLPVGARLRGGQTSRRRAGAHDPGAANAGGVPGLEHARDHPMTTADVALTTRAWRIAMVAGEASGDLLGAHLIASLQRRLPAARFFGIGGPKMQAAGFEPWYRAESLAVMGAVEVLRRLRSILRIRSELRRRLISEPPDLFVGIDAPDFNLAIERTLRRHRIPTVHYVSPSLWAWRRERIHTIKRSVDKILCLFPFEPEIYEKAAVSAVYVGHPLADMLPDNPDQAGAREQLKIPPQRTVIALLSAGRQGELRNMAELSVEPAKLIRGQIPDVQFLVPLLSRITRRLFEDAMYRADGENLPLTILFGHAHLAMTACDAVLLACGTAALEAALLKRPMVVTYKGSPLSYAIARPQIYLPYVSLPNILSGRFIVPEIFQEDAAPEVLCQALTNLVFDKQVKSRQLQA